ARVREAHPDLAGALEEGRLPSAVDPFEVAAAAYLLRPSGWTGMVVSAGEEVERAASEASSSQAAEAVPRLEEQLAALRTQARADLDRLRGELDVARAEAVELRRRLREAQDAARRAEAAARTAEVATGRQRSAAEAMAVTTDAEMRRLRAKLTTSEAALEASRRATREGRSLAEARLRLLLDTVVEAAQGLRRELALPPAEVRPADVVDAVLPAGAGSTVPTRALGDDDPALLDSLLTLPQAHLVVDGYNVTKTGYGSLPLEAQRQRLITGLASLAARCGAEVTCCFDAAEVTTPLTSPVPRGVRVLFSKPGEIADELIRRLVRNEPAGRPVVVVSSDREVAEGVRQSGARAVPAVALLRLLERG
ncbi:MAG: NYN domain-containing protein, partial [Actinomycetota bacterium]|nr:NYN domain-containing protein [Actinomycetota bacterium]